MKTFLDYFAPHALLDAAREFSDRPESIGRVVCAIATFPVDGTCEAMNRHGDHLTADERFLFRQCLRELVRYRDGVTALDRFLRSERAERLRRLRSMKGGRRG